MTPLLFVNIGWQVHYQGARHDDPTIGGHGHLRVNSFGQEAWNYEPLGGFVYGYIPRETSINLQRLGASKSAAVLQGVTVVWLARDPRDRKTKIVGWYENAEVHRNSGSLGFTRSGHFVSAQVAAQATKAHLIHRDARRFEIPTAKVKGCLGQSPVWYGTDDVFRQKVRTYIAAGGRQLVPNPKRGAGRSNDPAARKRIEVAAVDFATKYYSSDAGGNRTVQSVETEALGWDLHVSMGETDCLKVEVKGVSAELPIVELTPNEYKAMTSSEHKRQYVVFIVTGLGEGLQPKAHIFEFDPDLSTRTKPAWVSQAGRVLHIDVRPGARLTG